MGAKTIGDVLSALLNCFDVCRRCFDCRVIWDTVMVGMDVRMLCALSVVSCLTVGAVMWRWSYGSFEFFLIT